MAAVDPLSHDETDLDPEYVLSGDDEQEKERQIQSFVLTSKMLLTEDGISELSDAEIAKWLFAKGGHRGKAMAALSESLAWRKNFNIAKLFANADEFKDLEASGKLQFFGRAVDKSAILVWTGSRHVPPKTEQDTDRDIRFVVYMLERARRQGQFPDKVTVIIDRSGMRTDKSDIKVASTLIPILQNHFPERLSRMYIFPTNTLFWMAWKMASMYMDKATIPKIFIKDSPAALSEWIARENMFTRYGGLAADAFDAVPNADESAQDQEAGTGTTAKLKGGPTDAAKGDDRSTRASTGSLAGGDGSPRHKSLALDGTSDAKDSKDGINARDSSASIASTTTAAATTGATGMAVAAVAKAATVLRRNPTKADKALVTIEHVWEAPNEFHDV
ncbi:CRAL-TRIO domain-containing protein [Entophlyctis helioformis]|nr:CRAL-TRIO domain-containing protein [Entophlyctis helioformis]